MIKKSVNITKCFLYLVEVYTFWINTCICNIKLVEETEKHLEHGSYAYMQVFQYHICEENKCSTLFCTFFHNTHAFFFQG